MRHRKTKLTLDRTAKQRRPLLRNLAVALITRERIVTTAARGRAVRSFVERLITTGKRNDLAARRQLIRRLADAKAADKVLGTLAPRYKTRPGGYARTVKMSPRQGDGAERIIVELITEEKK